MFYVHFIEIAVTENLNLAIDLVLKHSFEKSTTEYKRNFFQDNL